MKILVVGGGGREHAIIKKLKENQNITEIYALPGNGGIAADATCVAIGAKDIEKIVAFAKDIAVDYAIVAPDDPLVAWGSGCTKRSRNSLFRAGPRQRLLLREAKCFPRI